MRRSFPRLKDGDPIEPYHLNVIYRELERWNKASSSGAIRFLNREGGPHWFLASAGAEGEFVGLVDASGFTARSGTTLGHGTVRRYRVNADDTVTDTGIDDRVLNFTGGALAGSKWCRYARVNGQLVLTSIEC